MCCYSSDVKHFKGSILSTFLMVTYFRCLVKRFKWVVLNTWFFYSYCLLLQHLYSPSECSIAVPVSFKLRQRITAVVFAMLELFYALRCPQTAFGFGTAFHLCVGIGRMCGWGNIELVASSHNPHIKIPQLSFLRGQVCSDWSALTGLGRHSPPCFPLQPYRSPGGTLKAHFLSTHTLSI